eukprot:5153283-Amphidinium_carterae.1
MAILLEMHVVGIVFNVSWHPSRISGCVDIDFQARCKKCGAETGKSREEKSAHRTLMLRVRCRDQDSKSINSVGIQRYYKSQDSKFVFMQCSAAELAGDAHFFLSHIAMTQA